MSNFQIHTSAKAVGIPSPFVVDWMRKRAAESGLDPKSVPEIEYCFLRPRRVMELTGLCQTVLYDLIAKGVFPKIRIDQQPSRTEAANESM